MDFELKTLRLAQAARALPGGPSSFTVLFSKFF